MATDNIGKIFNVGIIGAGRFAQSVMIPAMLANDNFQPIAIYSRNFERACQIANSFGEDIRPYDNLDEMLANDKIEVVYIASPPHTHLEYVIASCQAGKMIICEKPLARTLDEGKKIVEAVIAANVLFVTNYSITLHPAQQEIIKLVKDNLIGEPIGGRVNFGFYFDRAEWDWRVRSATGAGPMMDLGIHCINFLRNIFGQADRVVSLQSKKIFPDMECSESISALIEYEGGSLSVVECSFARNSNTVEVYGSKGSLIGLNTFSRIRNGEIIHFDAEGNRSIIPVEGIDLFTNALNRFAEIFHGNSNCQDDILGPRGALEDLIVALSALDESNLNILTENEKL